MYKGKKHIVIVDDEASIRLSIAVVLTAAGCKVSSFASAVEAMKMMAVSSINNDSVDLLVCDIVMPEVSGIQLMQELTATGVHIPVIAMTGVIDNVIIQQVKAMPNCRLIIKPFDRDELLQKVAEAFSCAPPCTV